jgi:hypothetical protein
MGNTLKMLPIVFKNEKRNMKKTIILLIILFSISLNAKENFSIKLSLKNGNNKTNDKMAFGLNINATDAIDTSLGEKELPPPLTDVFGCSSFIGWDSVLESNVYQNIDYKNFPLTKDDSVEFIFNVYGIVNSYTVSWDTLPKNITFAMLRSFYLFVDYNDIDMIKNNSVEITNQYLSVLKIVLKYNDNLAIDDNKKELTIYPNPISQSFYIKGGQRLTDLKIIDLMGNEIMQLNSEQSSFDISSLNAGTYYLKIIDENNNSILKKLIKI